MFLGIRKLESEYIRVIRYHFETLKTLKSESNISKEEFITRRRNHNTDNIEVKHFKVTNWEPAMAGEEENINTQQRPGQQYVLIKLGIPGFRFYFSDDYFSSGCQLCIFFPTNQKELPI